MTQPVQIKAGDAEVKGVYSNFMEIKHTKEEFCLDFLNIFPPIGAMTARIIMSPGHFKRMLRAMGDSLGKYENGYGEVKEAEEPEKPNMGFAAK